MNSGKTQENSAGSCMEFLGDFGSNPRVRRISPKLSRDVPNQIAGHPIHYLSKTTKKAPCIEFLFGTSRAGVRDIPTCGSLMSQEYPAQKLYL